MASLELTGFITAIANFISCEVDENNLELLGAAFTQLGDTITVIAIQKNLCKK